MLWIKHKLNKYYIKQLFISQCIISCVVDSEVKSKYKYTLLKALQKWTVPRGQL